MVDVTDRPERRPSLVPQPDTGPQRTCVGCRTKAARSVLMRIVAVDIGGGVFIAEPDLRRQRPGRGAWLHPVPDCFDLATRRRAFARALRLPGPLDASALRAMIEFASTTSSHGSAESWRRSEPEAGYSADEHPMSTQQ